MQGKLQQKPTHLTSQKKFSCGCRFTGEMSKYSTEYLQWLLGTFAKIVRIYTKAAQDIGKGSQ